eukprot:14332423-Heterocapsa_arctica.AAC.1
MGCPLPCSPCRAANSEFEEKGCVRYPALRAGQRTQNSKRGKKQDRTNNAHILTHCSCQVRSPNGRPPWAARTRTEPHPPRKEVRPIEFHVKNHALEPLHTQSLLDRNLEQVGDEFLREGVSL